MKGGETMLKLLRDERGEDMIEYALLVLFIALIAIVGIELVGGQVNAVFNDIFEALGGTPG